MISLIVLLLRRLPRLLRPRLFLAPASPGRLRPSRCLLFALATLLFLALGRRTGRVVAGRAERRSGIGDIASSGRGAARNCYPTAKDKHCQILPRNCRTHDRCARRKAAKAGRSKNTGSWTSHPRGGSRRPRGPAPTAILGDRGRATSLG